jgi:hypothetical protein
MREALRSKGVLFFDRMIDDAVSFGNRTTREEPS